MTVPPGHPWWDKVPSSTKMFPMAKAPGSRLAGRGLRLGTGTLLAACTAAIVLLRCEIMVSACK